MDIQYLLALQSFREGAGAFLTPLMSLVTQLGEIGVTLVIITMLFWCYDKELGMRIAFSTLLAGFANGVLKLAACVYRPWVRDARVTPVESALKTATGYSFPSGHATTAAAYAGEIADELRIRKHRAAAALALAVVLLVMFSRNFLGVHTPQDVLLGMATGFACIALTRFVYARMDAARARGMENAADLALIGGACALSLLAGLWFIYKRYPLDTDAAGALIVDPKNMQADAFFSCGTLPGLALAYVLERRFVHYAVPKKLRDKGLTLLAGYASVGLLYAICDVLLRQLVTRNVRHCVNGFILTIWCLAIFPMLAMKVRQLTKDRG